LFDDKEEVVKVLKNKVKKTVLDLESSEFAQHFEDSDYPKQFLT